VLAVSAVISILMTVLVFPLLHKAIPEPTYLRLCRILFDHSLEEIIFAYTHPSTGLSAYPVAVLFFPLMWALHRSDSAAMSVGGWTTLAVQMVIRRIGDFSAT
jgi:hypothetical protein